MMIIDDFVAECGLPQAPQPSPPDQAALLLNAPDCDAQDFAVIGYDIRGSIQRLQNGIPIADVQIYLTGTPP